MTLLDRYISKLFLSHLLLAIFAFVALFLFQAILADIGDPKYSSHQVVIYHALNVPQILVQMMPPSVLLATVLTLSGLSRTHELTACLSIGYGTRRIVLLILTLVFMTSCLMLIFQDRILPPTYRKRTTYHMREMEKKPDFFLDIHQDKIWYRSQQMIYNLKRFDPKSATIFGMSIYQFNSDYHLVQLIQSESAHFEDDQWTLTQGTLTVFSPEDPFPLIQKFEKRSFELPESPADFKEIDKEVKGLRLLELRGYIQRSQAAGADTKSYEVDFHSRMSLSFIPLVMCVLGVPFSLSGRRDGSLARDLGLCLGVTVFYWLFYSVGLSLGTNGQIPAWVAAWLPSTIFAAFALVMIVKQRT